MLSIIGDEASRCQSELDDGRRPDRVRNVEARENSREICAGLRHRQLLPARGPEPRRREGAVGVARRRARQGRPAPRPRGAGGELARGALLSHAGGPSPGHELRRVSSVPGAHKYGTPPPRQRRTPRYHGLSVSVRAVHRSDIADAPESTVLTPHASPGHDARPPRGARVLGTVRRKGSASRRAAGALNTPALAPPAPGAPRSAGAPRAPRPTATARAWPPPPRARPPGAARASPPARPPPPRPAPTP